MTMLFPASDQIWDPACLLAERYSFQAVIGSICMNRYIVGMNCLPLMVWLLSEELWKCLIILQENIRDKMIPHTHRGRCWCQAKTLIIGQKCGVLEFRGSASSVPVTEIRPVSSSHSNHHSWWVYICKLCTKWFLRIMEHRICQRQPVIDNLLFRDLYIVSLRNSRAEIPNIPWQQREGRFFGKWFALNPLECVSLFLKDAQKTSDFCLYSALSFSLFSCVKIYKEVTTFVVLH